MFYENENLQVLIFIKGIFENTTALMKKARCSSRHDLSASQELLLELNFSKNGSLTKIM